MLERNVISRFPVHEEGFLGDIGPGEEVYGLFP